MSRSMTGYGKAAGEFGGQSLTVEISSVNHRYLDCSLRLPSAWVGLDPIVKQTIRKHLTRGKLTVNVSRKRALTSTRSVNFDGEVARQYLNASRELAQMIGTYETLSLNVLAQLDGVFYQEEADEDLTAVEPIVVQVTEEALTRLDEMRAQEGRHLADDVRQRVEGMKALLADIEKRLPELRALYEERLRTRIGELKAEVTITEDRLALEVALLAEKSDVTEEVVRLKTHFGHMIDMLDANEPAGRRLDFLSQEIQREINTLGVKTRDGNVAKIVLEMKAELEKIREQIQNIE
ncbi:MAG: YicC family protein [Candidatus Hydrogenedentes bacterium]|nr:YicC family protein [Candidatus Hydrogenedentota bacterium]